MENGITPVPSSSPCGLGVPTSDSMDYSPLPHKPAFSIAQKQSIESPSRRQSTCVDLASNDEEMKPATSAMDTLSKPEFKFPSFE
jgi:hypothetical protein